MSLVFDHVTLINLCISNYREATGAMFIHAKSVKKVLKLLVFVFFSFFVILNIMVETFQRTTMFYLIAKVERK